MSPRAVRRRGGGGIGLALAGGGPQGAVYEIGALQALDETLEGLDFNDVRVWVGVSAGAFVAALLANGLSPAQMCRAVARHDHGVHPIAPEIFFTPASGAWLKGGVRIPRLALEAFAAYARNPRDLSLLESLTRLAHALPVGLFDNEPIRRYLRRVFALPGRTDDFRDLGGRLVIVAADVDSGEAVRFGAPGWDHVPISTAVQASTALPMIYPPVSIGGSFYADGVLLKTLHASVALDEGVALLVCVNPIVPVDTVRAAERGEPSRRHLVEGGLPTVLSQTFRTLIHSRLVVGFEGYARRYPDRDIVLLEPPRDDFAMFFTNIFSFASRLKVLDHAWRSTRTWLKTHRRRLDPVLARHGIRIRDDVLDDEDRNLSAVLNLDGVAPRAPVTVALDRLLTRLEEMAGVTR